MQMATSPAPTHIKPRPKPNRDANICPNCGHRATLDKHWCAKCGTTVLVSSRSAISFWILGDAVDMNGVAELARLVSHALSWPVVVQPGRLDPRPSHRPGWGGRSGTSFLSQLLRRHQPGCLVNFGITGDHIVSAKKENWMFGYAYLNFQAACMSMKPLISDDAGLERLMIRAKSVCLHEIGHTLGLLDHYDDAGRRCVMHGTVSAEELYETAAYSSDFCDSCFSAIKEALKAIDAAADDDGTRFIPTLGATFAGRYLLRRFIDQGGMGAVWQALDLSLAQSVAVKFVASRRFDRKREVQLVAEAAKTRLLSHPNIVRVFDLARDAGAGALIMHWVDGESLETIRKSRRYGLFRVSEIQQWIRELCRAVACAHRARIFHLDIKPQNCLIDEDGRLMLTDFGIAGIGYHTVDEFSVFHTRGRGTPGYAAPEQLAGHTATVAQDIYGIGATIYCLLAGHPPRMHPLGISAGRKKAPEDLGAALWKIRSQVPPTEWILMVERCIAWDPARRPASVDEIMDGLGLGEVLGEAFRSKTLPSRESFWKKLRRWVGFDDDLG
jgi:predicted Zn-dependent protease